MQGITEDVNNHSTPKWRDRLPGDSAAGESPGAARKWNARFGAGVMLVAAVGAVAASILASVLVQLGGASKDAPIVDTLGRLALSGALIAIMLWLVRRRGPVRAADFGLRRVRWSLALPWVLGLGVLVEAFNIGYEKLFSIVDAIPNGGVFDLAFAMLAICVVTPIVEEVFFRGFLFASLSNWRGIWIGAIFSSLVFGIVHALGSDPILLPAIALNGLVLALLYWRTGSLLPGIALHSFNNALALVMLEHWTAQASLLAVVAIALAILIAGNFARPHRPLITT